MRRLLSFLLLPILLAPSLAHAAAPVGLVYDRTLMSVAGDRCHLFAPDVASALKAGAAQAKGAALRAGADPADVRGAETRATAKALTVPCNSHDLAVVADRVRGAYHSFAQMPRMTFAGAVADWRAEKPLATKPSPQWLLVQFSRAPSGPVLFGLAGDHQHQGLAAAFAWPAALRASEVRLVFRDPFKAGQPYIDPRRKDLAGRLPPRALTQTFLAGTRTPAPPQLLPTQAKAGALFRFRPEATEALEKLDPREAALIEIVYPALNGERVESAWIEVGDFAAGRAFLATGR
jgi:hypothetical protein